MKGFFNTLLKLRQIEYLTIDRTLCVMDYSPGVHLYADSPDDFVRGQLCTQGLPELIGIESMLYDLMAGVLPGFSFPAIARPAADGTLLYFDLHATQLEQSDAVNGALVLWFEACSDRMNLEQRLVQATNEMGLLVNTLSATQNYTDQIITSMADALIVTTATGVIKTVNQTTQTLLGYSEAELIGQPFAMLVADKHFLPQVIQPTDSEVVCYSKQGERLTISFSCALLQTAPDIPPDFLYVGRDVTERQRTQQRLMVQFTTASILSESATLSAAITKILPALCRMLEWDVVELWLPEGEKIGDEQDSVSDEGNTLNPALTGAVYPPSADLCLHCAESWSRSPNALAEFLHSNRQLVLESGKGMGGRIWATRSPLWIANIHEDAEFAQAEIARKVGLQSAFGLPIQNSDEVLGVLTFFHCEIQPFDPVLLRTMMAIGNQLGQFIQRKRAETALHQEQRRTEHLLRNILPHAIADRLKQEQSEMQQNGQHWSGIAEHFDCATVLFADLVNFTEITASFSPIQLVNLLNEIFSTFDRLSDQHGLEKIKTIGDAYMVVGGIPKRRADHAQAIANMALDMQAAIDRFNAEFNQTFQMRIGIHTGPVIAGVIGIKKFTYDLWGDTVNTASRMESHGIAGQIHVSTAAYTLLQPHYRFAPRGNIPIKSKGTMQTYWLTGHHLPNSFEF